MREEKLIRAFAQSGTATVPADEATLLLEIVKKVARKHFKGHYGDPKLVLGQVCINLMLYAGSFNGYGKPGAAQGWLSRIILNCIKSQISADIRYEEKHQCLDELFDAFQGLVRGEVGEPAGFRLLGNRFEVVADLDRVLQFLSVPDTTANRQSALETLLRAVGEMKTRHPQTAKLILLTISRHSRSDIAQQLGVEIGSLRTRILNARHVLLKYLPRDWNEGEDGIEACFK